MPLSSCILNIFAQKLIFLVHHIPVNSLKHFAIQKCDASSSSCCTGHLTFSIALSVGLADWSKEWVHHLLLNWQLKKQPYLLDHPLLFKGFHKWPFLCCPNLMVSSQFLLLFFFLCFLYLFHHLECPIGCHLQCFQSGFWLAEMRLHGMYRPQMRSREERDPLLSMTSVESDSIHKKQSDNEKE